jgi:hypothetical protein
MDKKNIIVFISIITCCSIILFVISQASALALTPFTSKEYYSSNTSIGKVNIASLQQDQAKEKVSSRIDNWKNKKNIRLTFLNKEHEVPDNVFQFSVSDSFQTVRNGKENPLVVEINNSEILNVLKQLGMESIMEEMNLNKLKTVLKQYAINFSESKLDINMEQFLFGFNDKKISNLSTVEIPIDNQNLMGKWLVENKSLVMKSNSVFSLSDTFKNNMINFINKDYASISKISSGIYKAALQTNLKVMERNISASVPQSIELGLEAYINDSNMDLKLYNPNDYSIRIKSKKIAFNKMEITIEGPTLPLQYIIAKENEKIYPQRTIVEYVPSQDMERSEVGRSGYSIDVYKEIYLKQTLIERQLVSKDFYLPKENIEYKYLQSGGNEINNNTPTSNNTDLDTGNTTTSINDNSTIPDAENDSNSLNENANNNTNK